MEDGSAVAFVRQGDQRLDGKFSLFGVNRYPLNFLTNPPPLEDNTRRYLEA
jgi:hypothetical protein